MEVVHTRCCGIDVHQASLAVCVAIKKTGRAKNIGCDVAPRRRSFYVNARHVKKVPGRLQHLHSVGLLHASFRPQ